MNSVSTARPSTLSLTGLKLPVKIGHGEDERLVPQSLSFDIHFRFPNAPQGCMTDDLKDTICYFQVSKTIEEICNRTNYCLIEKLAWEVLTSLKATLENSILIQLTLRKPKPLDMANLEGGASFTIGDWI